jgi:transcription antitermination factor NusG
MECETISAMAKRQSWFALYVRTRRERTVAASLVEKGYETYLPLMSEKRYYSKKTRSVGVPCFPGYLFCRLDPINRLSLMMTPDIYSIVKRGTELEAIPDTEISALKVLLASGTSLERYTHLSAGDEVYIRRGPLAGIQGVLLRTGCSQRVAVSITLLQRSVSAEVDYDDIAPVATYAASTIITCYPGAAKVHQPGLAPYRL